MNPLLAVTILFFAIIGGVIGWRRASSPLPRRPQPESSPPSGAAEREELRRRMHRRIRLTIIYALLGIVVGLFALLLAQRR